MKSEEILILLIGLIREYLAELSKLPKTDFIHGELTAYIECLEIISMWDSKDKYLHSLYLEKIRRLLKVKG